MFDIYKYDRRLLDDYMGICNDLETALRSFDTLHSDIYDAFEALQEVAEDIEEKINICSMRLGNAHLNDSRCSDSCLHRDINADGTGSWITIDDPQQMEFHWLFEEKP